MATRNESETKGESPHGWARVAERGSLLGMRVTVWCYRKFGRRLFLCLIHAIVTYFFLTDRAGRKASRDYLARIWRNPRGREILGTPPRTWQSFLHYREFALAIVDRLAIWSGETAPIDFDVHGIELVDRLAAQGRGALVLGAHLGSFDAMRLLAERTQTAVNVLMFTTHAQRINRIFQELSPDATARVIAVEPGWTTACSRSGRAWNSARSLPFSATVSSQATGAARRAFPSSATRSTSCKRRFSWHTSSVTRSC